MTPKEKTSVPSVSNVGIILSSSVNNSGAIYPRVPNPLGTLISSM